MGMVVRSNIMALNANRQLGMNNAAVSKSLEKLSSGFRINRAGDDASGLAISEKMKAQIKGLETASANSQDGISLIQTAEGNLTEVHDMLNRMVELAEKSANGTMETPEDPAYGAGGTDRNALQAEMDALSKEIDRIADSANFNNIKLLDGSLSTASAGKFTITSANKGDMGPATPSVSTATINVGSGPTGAAQGIKITNTGGQDITLKFTNATGAEKGNSTVSWNADGTQLTVNLATKSSATYTLDEINSILAKAGSAANAPAGASVSLSATSGAEKAGLGTAWTTALNNKTTVGGAVPAPATVGTTTLDFAGKTKEGLDGASFNYGGKKYVLAGSQDTKDIYKDMAGVTVVDISAADTDIATAVSAAIAAAKYQSDGATDDTVVAAAGAVTVTSGGDAAPAVNAGKGLVLQIGDTSEKFNKMEVSVDDMHMYSLFNKAALEDTETGTGTAKLVGLDNGTKSLDISSQDNAGAAMTAVKKVINSVSTQRANLGALQNRLEHTINNLDVAAENMSSANSRIRDTDMAKQMMDYTKMNVLTQAAQAMLAQANQQPQSVLQLLQ